MIDEIKDLAKQKNAVIMAHNYQNPEIQDIADHTGDSLELARIASQTKASIIVFCGVHFMAESASILSPDKKVLLPDLSAGCPMADMIDAEKVRMLKKKHPDARVVTYINSTAEVKTVSDVICTSSNARKIVDRIDSNEIIFVPDKNLGSYVQRFTSKKIILSDGFCPTHEKFTVEMLRDVKAMHPDAYVIVHPECRPEVVDLADAALSTGEMVKFAATTDKKKVIVGTESALIHRLKKANPNIEFIPAGDSFICPNMKKINLAKLLQSLRDEIYEVKIDIETAALAKIPLDRMLELSY